MRVAVISDVHSNLEALTAVLKDIKAQGGVERIYSLGDVVGYGPCPRKCLEELLGHRRMAGFIKGNHDYGVGNFDSQADDLQDTVNTNAFAGMEYSRGQMTSELLAEINSWPEKLVVEDIGLSLAHGSFARNHMWRYVNEDDGFFADEELESSSTSICVVGHTHHPFAYQGGKWIAVVRDAPLLINGEKLLVNVGSVGQPRDLNPRASYGLFTFGKKMSFTLRRVVYDVAKTVKAIKLAKLPVFLHERLLSGL